MSIFLIRISCSMEPSIQSMVRALASQGSLPVGTWDVAFLMLFAVWQASLQLQSQCRFPVYRVIDFGNHFMAVLVGLLILKKKKEPPCFWLPVLISLSQLQTNVNWKITQASFSSFSLCPSKSFTQQCRGFLSFWPEAEVDCQGFVEGAGGSWPSICEAARLK